MRNIISKATKITLKFNNEDYGDIEIKSDLIKLLESSYFAPSYINADDINLEKIQSKGIWLELFFDNEQNYKDYRFNSLSLEIKPKYNFLTFFRDLGGKCININLAYKTTDLYEKLKGIINEK